MPHALYCVRGATCNCSESDLPIHYANTTYRSDNCIAHTDEV